MATTTAAGTKTKEYQAIKRHYARLVDTLGKTVDPADFARKLREKSLISDSEYCNVIASHLSSIGSFDVLTCASRICKHEVTFTSVYFNKPVYST